MRRGILTYLAPGCKDVHSIARRGEAVATEVHLRSREDGLAVVATRAELRLSLSLAGAGLVAEDVLGRGDQAPGVVAPDSGGQLELSVRQGLVVILAREGDALWRLRRSMVGVASQSSTPSSSTPVTTQSRSSSVGRWAATSPLPAPTVRTVRASQIEQADAAGVVGEAGEHAAVAGTLVDPARPRAIAPVPSATDESTPSLLRTPSIEAIARPLELVVSTSW